MTNHKFQTYNGIDVYLDSAGEFLATVDGITIRDGRFEGIKRQIENERKATARSIKLSLPCVAIVSAGHDGEDNFSVQLLTLEGYNRNDSSFKWKEHVEGKVLFCLPRTDDNEDMLDQYAEAYNTVNRITGTINDWKLQQSYYGGRIQATEYAERIVGLRERYEAAVAACEGKKGARGKKP